MAFYSRTLLFMVLAVHTQVACVGSHGDARYAGMQERGKIGAKPTPSPYCQSVDARRDTWGAIAKGLALVSAAVAASVAAWKDSDKKDAAAIGAASGTAVSGGVFFYSETQGKLYARDCTDP